MFKLFLSLILLISISSAIFACDLVFPPLAVTLNRADIIIHGKVVILDIIDKVDDGPYSLSSFTHYAATIEISEVLKEDKDRMRAEKNIIVNFIRPHMVCVCGHSDTKIELNDEKIFLIFAADDNNFMIDRSKISQYAFDVNRLNEIKDIIENIEERRKLVQSLSVI